MREIKFRGQLISGEWVYGNLNIVSLTRQHGEVTIEKGHYISNSADCPFAYQIRPETVGQYTGLEDKKGNEIYEGDIIEYEEIESDGRRYPNKDRRKILWRDCGFNMCELKIEFWKVIGNIYENPELLEDGNKNETNKI